MNYLIIRLNTLKQETKNLRIKIKQLGQHSSWEKNHLDSLTARMDELQIAITIIEKWKETK